MIGWRRRSVVEEKVGRSRVRMWVIAARLGVLTKSDMEGLEVGVVKSKGQVRTRGYELDGNKGEGSDRRKSLSKDAAR